MTDIKNNIDTIAMVSFAMIGIFGIALIAGGLEDQDQWKLKFNIHDVEYTMERNAVNYTITESSDWEWQEFHDAVITYDGYTITQSSGEWEQFHLDSIIEEHLDDILEEAKEHQALYDLNGDFMFYLDSPEHEQFCEDNDWHLVCMSLEWSDEE